MEIQQWPLTAAATQILLDTPPAGAKRGAKPDPKAAAKLALKELIFRGAFTVEVRHHREEYLVLHWHGEVELPKSLRSFHRDLRPPASPPKVDMMIRLARDRHPTLLQDLEVQLRGELTRRQLVEERRERRWGLLSDTGWVRTASGDTWTADAEAHLDGLGTLASEHDVDHRRAATVVAAAGAALILVPAATQLLARVHDARGAFPPHPYLSVPADAEGAASFDPFGAVGGLLASVTGEGVDSGVEGVDSAVQGTDSSDSLDSALD
ncbi:MAG: hypothetical protein M3350_07305, partial [Actinomycetota bacterium]|nr:hypothetical protein [Actinomycetota bacterium]